MDDVSLLVPEDEDAQGELKARADEILKTILRLGITQLVFGVLLLVGGIAIACSWPDYGVDAAGEGIWCGVFVLICGALAIAARFHFYSPLVMTGMIVNIITAIMVGSGVIIAGLSTFSALGNRYEMGDMAKYGPLNCGLITCMVLSIYLSIIFGKVMSEKRPYCCFPTGAPMGYPGYAMVYVPPGAQSAPTPGAFMAVPGSQATQPPPRAEL